MNKLIINRILKSLDENITLIFYTTQKYGYIYYILGTSGFIYKITINKNHQSCNCEDYFKHKTLCKHLCFIFFKVLRIYKISLNNFDIKLIGKQSFIETDFFKIFEIPDLDWNIFKKKARSINKYLKPTNFNIDYYKKFKYYYQQYYFLIYKNLQKSDDKCPICFRMINKGIKCPTCKNIFHVYCLNTWFEKIEIKKCPICRCDYWNISYKYLILADTKKIKKNIIL